MAKDDKEDRYKEGVDFEWVKAKGSNYRTRRFFSKAEKRARAEKKNAAKATTDDKPTGSTRRSTESTASTPKTSPRPKPRPARPSPEMAAGKDKDRPRNSSRQGVMAHRSTRDRLGNVPASAPETPSQRTAFGDVPISSPHRDEALSRREAEAEARAKARAEGGRESPLGRMIDRIFSGDRDTTTSGSSSRRASRSSQGMAKGGMVMTNKGKVGASMVPTQNKFRTQTRKGKK